MVQNVLLAEALVWSNVACVTDAAILNIKFAYRASLSNTLRGSSKKCKKRLTKRAPDV